MWVKEAIKQEIWENLWEDTGKIWGNKENQLLNNDVGESQENMGKNTIYMAELSHYLVTNVGKTMP